MLNVSIGRREKGKTTLTVYMASKVRRRLMFDPRGLIRRPGAAIVRKRSDLQPAIDALADEEVAEVVYTPAGVDLNAEFEAFAYSARAWVLDAPVLPIAIVADETSFYDVATPAFSWVMKTCPRDTVHVFLTCHRPIDVPTSVRAIVDRWFLFQCRQEHDLKVIAERCSPAVAQQVERLNGREFVYWDDEHARATYFSNPESWYVQMAPKVPIGTPTDTNVSIDELGGKLPEKTSLF